jgi:hypothetical protein
MERPGKEAMKRILKIVVVVLAVAFIVIQFVRPDQTNPPVVAAESIESSTELPADVGAIISRSCSDCHTNTTKYPWYSQVSPASWFLANHVRDGRKELNFSIWNTYNDKRKSKKLEEICEQVQEGEMPLPSYLWIHWDARLKEGEAQTLCNWANSERARLGQ